MKIILRRSLDTFIGLERNIETKIFESYEELYSYLKSINISKQGEFIEIILWKDEKKYENN